MSRCRNRKEQGSLHWVVYFSCGVYWMSSCCVHFIHSMLHSLANLADDSLSDENGVSKLMGRAEAGRKEKASPTFGVS